MWLLVGTMVLLLLIVVGLKVMERRASKDLDEGAMPAILERRRGRNYTHG
jgi:hypothetical protein